jgi:hypothetical protein
MSWRRSATKAIASKIVTAKAVVMLKEDAKLASRFLLRSAKPTGVEFADQFHPSQLPRQKTNTSLQSIVEGDFVNLVTEAAEGQLCRLMIRARANLIPSRGIPERLSKPCQRVEPRP